MLASIEAGEVILEPGEHDIPRIRQLTYRYLDLALGFSEAAVIACAERNGGRALSFDRRQFEVVSRDTPLVLVPDQLIQ